MPAQQPEPEGFYERIGRQKKELFTRIGKSGGADRQFMNRLRALDELEQHPPFEPLLEALRLGNLADVIKFSKDGRDIPDLNRQRIALLAQPTYAGNAKIVDYLLSKGAEVNIGTHDNLTALSMAAMSDEDEIFKKLLQAGADPNVKTKQGDSIRDLARFNGSEKVLKILKNQKLIAKLTGKPPLSISAPQLKRQP